MAVSMGISGSCSSFSDFRKAYRECIEAVKNNEMMAEEGVTIIRVTPEEQKLWNEAAQAIWPKFIGEGKMVDQGLFDRVAAME